MAAGVRKKQEIRGVIKSVNKHVSRIIGLKASIASIDAMLADDPAMLAEITASYQNSKTKKENSLAAQRAALLGIKDDADADEDYTAAEKTAITNAQANEV